MGYADQLAMLQARSTRFAQNISSGFAEAVATSRGGHVQVRVGADGRFGGAVVGSAWRAEATPEELGGLIVETLAAAQGQQLVAWTAGFDVGNAATLPAEADPQMVRVPSGAEGDRFLLDASDSVGGLAGAMTELDSDLRAAYAKRYEFSAPADGVRARVDMHGTLRELSIGSVWLGRVDARALSESVTSAVLGAIAAADENDAWRTTIKGSRLGRYLTALGAVPDQGGGR